MESSLSTPDLFRFDPSSLSGDVRPWTSLGDVGIMSTPSAGSSQAIVPSDSLLSSPLVAPLAATPVTGTGTGLLGQYYNGLSFNSLQLTRIDPTVDFDWSLGSPGGLIETDRFSVRWTGKVQPKYSEAYTFYIRSDDGVRLWVNGKQIVNNWTLNRAVEESDTITLVAGETYDIKIEYYENTGAAISKLSWSSVSQEKQIIPQSQLYGPNLTLPTANLLPTNNTIINGSRNYQFSVVYSDNTRLNQSTIDNQDIRVTGPDNFSQLATLVNISGNPDSSVLTATYSIPAPGGIWNASIVGNFEITLQGNQVSDVDNNFIDSYILGNFQVDFVPPTATLVTKEPVLGGSTRYSFSVTYDDNLLVYPDTLDNQDLLVTGPNNFSQLAKLVSFSPLKNSRSVTGVYSIEAPNGIWDTKSTGIYTVALRSYQISDTNGNFIPATTLGIIKVDLTPPTATLAPLTSVISGSTGYEFTIVYSDETAVNRSTIDGQDILVTGSNNTTQLATLVSVSSSQESSPLTATYRIAAPGGTWDSADTGLYRIALQANQITDLNGNVMAASLLGTLAVDLTPPTAKLTALNISIEGQQTSSFTIVYSDDTAVNRSTIDRQEVLVTGPNKATQLATLVSVSSDQNGSPLTATYSITAPGGTWDLADIGAYTISLQANPVSDSGGNFMVAAELGTFWADRSTYTGDFDGDGKVDVLSRDLNRQTVSISLMNGTLPNNQVPLPDMPANYSIVNIADFNGDGKVDVLWRDSVSQKVVMWVMDGNILNSRAFLPDLSANYSIIDTADFDGDGNADLLWRNSVNQQVVIWLMDGTTVISQLFLRGYG